MNKFTICNLTYTDRKEEHVDFAGLVDAKGRALGAWVSTDVRTAVANGTNIGYCIEPGVWFAVKICGSRNGASYGSTGGTKYFRTKEERVKYIEKRLASIRSKAV